MLYNIFVAGVFWSVIIDQINVWFSFPFNCLAGSERFLTPSCSCSSHLIFTFWTVSLKLLLFAGTIFFTSYAAIIFNFIFNWKCRLIFSSVLCIIKPTFDFDKVDQLFMRLFTSFALYSYKGKQKLTTAFWSSHNCCDFMQKILSSLKIL